MFRCTHCGAFNRVATGHAGEPMCGRCKKSLDVSGAPQPVDSEGYDRAVSASPVPVLVDFWAPWCGPCRAAAPILEKIGRSLAGRVVVLKVNSDENPKPSASLGIQGIPTFVMFSQGKEIARRAGVMPENAMLGWVGQQLPA